MGSEMTQTAGADDRWATAGADDMPQPIVAV